MSNRRWWQVLVCFPTLCPIMSAQSLVAAPSLPYAAPAPVGDVDGDGSGDYAGVLAGTAFVHSGATGAAIAFFTRAAVAYEYYGPAGDLNADGYDDVVWLSASGLATAASGADGSTLWSWPTTSDGTGHGAGFSPIAVVGGADFDADGFDDVILRTNGLRYDVRSGRTGQLLHSDRAGLYPVFAAFVIGDTDGDGFVDLTTCEPGHGRFTIVRGPSFATTILGSTQRCWVGDVNGNGAIDHAIHFTTGITEVRDGANNQLLGTLPVTLPLSAKPILTPAGDVNGDGHADFHAAELFAFGVPYRGIVSGATCAMLSGTSNDMFVSVGDIDGDGRVEVANTGGGAFEWHDPVQPLVSRCVRRGASGTTSLGTRLRLQTRGSCVMGRQLFIDLRGMLPGGFGLFAIGDPIDVDLGPFGAPGNRAYATHGGIALVQADPAGLTMLSFTMPIHPSFLGTVIASQAAVLDVAANPLNAVASNAIDLHTDS